MEDVVIYYTKTGNTKLVADTISKEKSAKMIEIKDLKDRNGITGFLKSIKDSIKENQTEIKPEFIDLEKYNMIYIGSPVWASKPVPAINEIIEACNFGNKDVVTFVTMKDEGMNALKLMNDLITSRGGHILKSFAIASGNPEDMKELTIKSLNKN